MGEDKGSEEDAGGFGFLCSMHTLAPQLGPVMRKVPARMASLVRTPRAPRQRDWQTHSGQPESMEDWSPERWVRRSPSSSTPGQTTPCPGTSVGEPSSAAWFHLPCST